MPSDAGRRPDRTRWQPTGPPSDGCSDQSRRSDQVNGPSFVSDTRISRAEHGPSPRWRPARAAAPTTSSTSGSATWPGRGGVPGGPAALAGVAVERELADHQQRGVDVGAGLLVVQHAHRPEFAGELGRLLRGVLMGHADQDAQSLADDLADRLAPSHHDDARAVHPLHHCSHTDHHAGPRGAAPALLFDP